ncbi:transcriptional regulator, AraC family [Desulfitobacterium hafniense DCB-2]|uniref:Transcriptional regulator, AraC family n=2 Tax=root TaxID=1 RepID=B8FSY0_DESHD|nr:AraC family transcriptional regulator [Desulfitobacterium hafniense]ACL21996.1 transcriptional regulator, AraC family [Desulfitobacterium hafniense DCB-2]MEA5022371.1 AraC family transcriptional regulator [Desulfitobacterium hafniense]
MDYRKALEHAVMYIENHLGSDIKVEDVAKAAGYSYYHLNRQFTAILGESIGSYIKKRRLADAAKKILYTNRKIIDIAMENGFESPEAFSRAFKAIYKVSPQTYRQNRLDTFIAGKERLDSGLLDHLARNVTVHPKIVELPEIKVAGLRGETTLRDNRLRELWDRANSLYIQIPNRIPNGRAFGICEACAENTLYTMNDDILFTEVAGIEVSSFAGLTEPFVQKIIPGGRYAVFTHRGTLGMLPQTFDYIWGTWFLTTKEEMDWREDFELYDERFLGYDHPDSEVDLYIPIR